MEVAEVFRRYGEKFRLTGRISSAQHRVMDALVACRTAALGGHVDRCDRCGHEQISYNSCRNRHCPKCQAGATAQWLDKERANLLPVPYAHVVFTLPQILAPLARQNPRSLYSFLFHAAAQALLVIAANPRHLGGQIGFLAILHTWGQTLLHHPHVHCLIPAGALSPDGQRWIACKPGFFLPVRVLSRLFRGKFLARLQRAYRQHQLSLRGSLAPLNEPTAFARLLRAAREKDWVVYAKPPFGGPDQALKYLARYTHRVAISNSRLLSLENDRVRFSWKDYAREGRNRTLALPATEFIRRFLLHVLPRGFVRIRHYGFLANRHRVAQLDRCLSVLGAAPAPVPIPAQAGEALEEGLGHLSSEQPGASPCPVCQVGRLRTIGLLEPIRQHERLPPLQDSS
ncbi:MAG: IS91 family transposase [Gemmatimonadetes bacterium]|nr:IS91 family transposase [Gemmatimonadota bacterium]